MAFEIPYATNPFASPIISTPYSSTPSIPDADIPRQQPDILTTANLLLEQLKELETLCSAAEERVQRKRQTVKDLEKLVAASATTSGPPLPSPVISATTPTSRRLRFMSPRLRGLFDLRGPGKANPVSFQNPKDYSPESAAATHLQVPLSAEKELGQAPVATVEEEWEDDDEEALLLCPFDDKYALKLQENPSPFNALAEKPLPAIPIHSEPEEEVRTTKIPKLHLKRRVSTSKYFTGRSGAVTRVPSSKRRPSLRHAGAKQLESATSPKGLKKKGTIRLELGQRGLLENVNGKTKVGMKAPRANENKNTSGKEGTRRKEKRKGLWSIYSVYSELGLSGSHHTVSASRR